MGSADSKLHFRKAFVELTTKTRPIDPNDDEFWDQFWSDTVSTTADIFTLIPANEIRQLRDESPNNLATLCYKSVEKLVKAVDTSCRTTNDQHTALNCIRLLTRIIPYMFEDPDWRSFFWSSLPSSNHPSNNASVGLQSPPPITDDVGRSAGSTSSTSAYNGPGGGSRDEDDDDEDTLPLAKALISALCDLLFCPDFTVSSNKKSGPDRAEDLQSIDSCEYIWESGVGFAHSPSQVPGQDCNRAEILKLLLACFSETIYIQPMGDALVPNKWIEYFSSSENRHALPLFTSLINIVCAYDPVGMGLLPYNHLIFTDSREPLVEAALQVLIVVLDHDTNNSCEEDTTPNMDNLFINYISRIHREEDFAFILKGFTRLLNNPLMQTYLPNSTKKIQFHQELLIFFWKMCDYNKKFLYFVLKSSDVLDILVPILYHLNDSRADQSRVGLMHIGVFILLLLSGERNFGVRLNKPYSATLPMDIPVFSGTHADLLIIVFHKIITTGHQRLQPLFDCLLTILVNVSPYLKTLSMVSSTKLLHFLEAFSTPWFLLSGPSNHHLVFFLLEIFNNIIQYQFDGNSNLVYTIIRKRQVFHSLANLATDPNSINKSLAKKSPLIKKPSKGKLDLIPERSSSTSSTASVHKERKNSIGASSTTSSTTAAAGPPSLDSPSMEGSKPALPAEPGTLKVSLANMPGIEKMTEKESAHPSPQQLNQLTGGGGGLVSINGGLINLDEPDQLLNPTSLISSSGKKSPSKDVFAEQQGSEWNSANSTTIRQQPPPPLTKSGSQEEQEATTSTVAARKEEHDEHDDEDDDAPLSLQESPGHTASSSGVRGGGISKLSRSQSMPLADGGEGPESAGNKGRHPSASSTASGHSFRNGASSSGGGHGQIQRSFTVLSAGVDSKWKPNSEWVQSWKSKLPLQTLMRLLQVLVPQVEKICIDKGLTDESEILKFLQHGTLVGLLPVPHPILIRKYQANSGTTMWFRTYMWGVIYLRNTDPPVWYDTEVKLFEIQRV